MKSIYYLLTYTGELTFKLWDYVKFYFSVLKVFPCPTNGLKSAESSSPESAFPFVVFCAAEFLINLMVPTSKS